MGHKEPKATVHSVGPNDGERVGGRQYDRGRVTCWINIVGLGVIWILAIACIVVAGPFMTSYKRLGIPPADGLSTTALVRIIAFAASLAVTLCNESLGLAHSVVLRWALWREQRLHFNTNLRLLSVSRTSMPNNRVFNLLFFFAVVLSYTASGQLIEPDLPDGPPGVLFNPVALLILGGSFLIQAAIVTWALIAERKVVLSWSTDPMNTCLVASQNGLTPVPNRSIVSYNDHDPNPLQCASPQKPLALQPSLFRSRASGRWTLYCLWLVVPITLAWAVIVSVVSCGTHCFDASNPNYILNTGHYVSLNTALQHTGRVTQVISIALSFSFQIYLTFSLHCAELLVNATRDEKAWRRATTKGARIDENAILAALGSWETMLLALFKAVAHWIFGQSVVVTFDGELVSAMSIFARCLLILAGINFCVAVFGFTLATRRRPGPQPTAFGHIQTIVNLVDDWGRDGEPLFWGDKGLNNASAANGIRHAGTQASDPGAVVMDAYYL